MFFCSLSNLTGSDIRFFLLASCSALQGSSICPFFTYPFFSPCSHVPYVVHVIIYPINFATIMNNNKQALAVPELSFPFTPLHRRWVMYSRIYSGFLLISPQHCWGLSWWFSFLHCWGIRLAGCSSFNNFRAWLCWGFRLGQIPISPCSHPMYGYWRRWRWW